MKMCQRDGGSRCRLCWVQMTDEEIAMLTAPELIELINRLMEALQLVIMTMED